MSVCCRYALCHSFIHLTYAQDLRVRLRLFVRMIDRWVVGQFHYSLAKYELLC